jgi:hypothetical protein
MGIIILPYLHHTREMVSSLMPSAESEVNVILTAYKLPMRDDRLSRYSQAVANHKEQKLNIILTFLGCDMSTINITVSSLCSSSYGDYGRARAYLPWFDRR